MEKRLNWARFPYHRPLYLFQIEEQEAITERQFKHLLEYDWLEQDYNLLLLGPPGAGKTLLSVGLGIEAINRWFQVYFITMRELIQLLKTEEYINKSKIQLKRLRASNFVITDDIMYIAMDQREATLFFQFLKLRSLLINSKRK